MKKRVFMVSYGGGHANLLKHVYCSLSRREDVEIYYLALTTAPLILQECGISFHCIDETVFVLPYYHEIVKLGEKYGEQYHNDSSGISKKDTIAYYGCGLYDLIKDHGKENGIKKFLTDGRKAFLPIGVMKDILAIVNPDVCVVTTSPRMEEACGIAANELGIPVVRINDLPITTPMSFSATVCVMNDWAKEYELKRTDIPAQNIIVTGQPVLEEDVSVDYKVLKNIRRELKADCFDRCVVFFTENGADQSEELRALYDIAEVLEDTLFIVKLHPNQNLDDFNVPCHKNVIKRKDAAKNYLHICDLAITTFSTTGLEAAMMGKPLVEINFRGSKYPMDYEDMGIAKTAHDPDELRNLITTLLDKESEDFRTLKDHSSFFGMVTGAADRIAEVVLSR